MTGAAPRAFLARDDVTVGLSRTLAGLSRKVDKKSVGAVRGYRKTAPAFRASFARELLYAVGAPVQTTGTDVRVWASQTR